MASTIPRPGSSDFLDEVRDRLEKRLSAEWRLTKVTLSVDRSPTKYAHTYSVTGVNRRLGWSVEYRVPSLAFALVGDSVDLVVEGLLGKLEEAGFNNPEPPPPPPPPPLEFERDEALYSEFDPKAGF